jgi:Flavin reductase like domain
VRVDVQTLLEVMAGLCSRVKVGTTVKGTAPHGKAICAFASLSLNPPEVTTALIRRSRMPIRELFGVNVLARSRQKDAKPFAPDTPRAFALAFRRPCPAACFALFNVVEGENTRARETKRLTIALHGEDPHRRSCPVI